MEKLKIQESTQITMITFWLLEIFEKQLADAKFIKGTVNEERKYQKDIESLLSIPAVYVRISIISKINIVFFFLF